jgi:hypothetical protein
MLNSWLNFEPNCDAGRPTTGAPLRIYLAHNPGAAFGESWKAFVVHLAACARPQQHTLIEAPQEADLILFAGADLADWGKSLRRHPLVRRFPEQCFMYSESDFFLPLLPGVYASATNSPLNLGRVASYCYLSSHFRGSDNSYVAPCDRPKKLLFSFMGGSTSWVRKRLFRMNFHRDDVLVENTASYQHWNLEQTGRDQRQARYAEIIASSHFVLCPRGAGHGTIRLFEVMEMGVAPVIISDRYLLPNGPDWSRCAVVLPEADISRLPELLEARLGESETIGRMAREAWETWFAPEKKFNYVIDACVSLQERRHIPERIYHGNWPFLVIRTRLRHSLRSLLRAAALKLVGLTRVCTQ